MRGHTLERAIVITMLVGLASEFLYAYSLGMREPQEMETGYMVRTNYTMEQLDRLASRVKEANATVVRVIELGVNATIENGTYVYNFSRWDQVIEIFVNHGLKILLDPQFHDVRFHPEWDESAYVLAGGRRMEHCPSIFDHRVRDYVVQTTEAIAKHYKYERPDLGDELIGIVLFNEPFMFNFCVWNPFVQEEPVIRRMLDEDPNHVEQDFRVQTEKFGEIVREMNERIKKHLDVPTLVTAELFYFMNPYATALYDSAWRYTDIVAIQLYVGPFEPFSWWIQKASIEKAILLGKPVWITEFGYLSLIHI